MLITIIGNNKKNIDVNTINKLGAIRVINIDTDAHKDVVFAKKLLYKWGSPSLPFIVIEKGKKTLAVLYSEKNHTDIDFVNKKIKVCLEVIENQ